MPKIALLTAAEARGLDADLEPLLAALAQRGAAAAAVDWDADVAWGEFDAAVLRSTWDYVPRCAEFLQFCDRAAQRTRLLNPPPVVRWNLDKHYLAALAQRGVPVVPTRFVEPGGDARPAIAAAAAAAEFVVKPTIGAGSKDALRFAAGERARAAVHAEALLGAGRSVMVQPYLASVDARGETAWVAFDGEFSHAIRKGPLLRRGAGLVEGLFAAEEIAPRVPTAAEHEVAQRALAALPFAVPTYARVDLIEDERGQPVVLELELVEPSLFFAEGAGSALRCADAILRRVAGGGA